MDFCYTLWLMPTPQKHRELVFHFLYSSDFVFHHELDDIFSFLMGYHKVTKKNLYLARTNFNEIQEHLPFIDETIQKISKEYELERIPKVERNLLRIGIFELCFARQIPPKVAISEAVRLSRKFATLESSKFVNAILDAFYKDQCKAADVMGE
jgi:transcription antitermination protein NusB